MPVRSDPQAATTKWVSSMQNATAQITRGVNAVTVSPGQKAAAAADKWLAKVTQAKAKFAARVGALSLQDWQTAMTNYGIPRIAQGATAKQGKMLAFQTEWLAFLNANQSKIDRMSTNTIEDGIAKVTAQIRLNASFRRTGAGTGA
jgi:hypothetical protein